MLRTIGKILLGLLVVILVIVVLLFLPYPTQSTIPAQPATSYEESVARHDAINEAESELALFPGCQSQLLTHGETTEQVVVLFHGYRACPTQFMALAEQLHERGYNVLLPRMPQMGLEGRPNDQHGQLTAGELVEYGTEALDIAQGLGDHVTVAGLSAGGLMTAWAVQYRDDVDHAVIISPFLAPQFLPDAIHRAAANFYQVVPNQFVWQDAELQENVPNPPQVYPRNATRAISEFMQLAYEIRRDAKQDAPMSDNVIFITNGADAAVDLDPVNELIDSWQSQSYESITEYQFAEALELDHDLIDHLHPNEKVEISHPVLLDYLVVDPKEQQN